MVVSHDGSGITHSQHDMSGLHEQVDGSLHPNSSVAVSSHPMEHSRSYTQAGGYSAPIMTQATSNSTAASVLQAPQPEPEPVITAATTKVASDKSEVLLPLKLNTDLRNHTSASQPSSNLYAMQEEHSAVAFENEPEPEPEPDSPWTIEAIDSDLSDSDSSVRPSAIISLPLILTDHFLFVYSCQAISGLTLAKALIANSFPLPSSRRRTDDSDPPHDSYPMDKNDESDEEILYPRMSTPISRTSTPSSSDRLSSFPFVPPSPPLTWELPETSHPPPSLHSTRDSAVKDISHTQPLKRSPSPYAVPSLLRTGWPPDDEATVEALRKLDGLRTPGARLDSISNVPISSSRRWTKYPTHSSRINHGDNFLDDGIVPPVPPLPKDLSTTAYPSKRWLSTDLRTQH
jgi:hypothetical protein